ncbi:hypothetical protein NBH05_06710 [Akkermansia sp. B2-R-115]|nr:hypothetical protein [Akkermansia sp. B2-R-115]
MIEVKNYSAKNGDAFLVRTSPNRFAMLIDGGYVETFQQYIKPDLLELAATGYVLDLVVATHVDADHILGLLSFFQQNCRSDTPTIIPVHQVFHNSLRSLMTSPNGQKMMRKDDLELLREIRWRGYSLQKNVIQLEHEISARQGNSLARLLKEGGYKWNQGTGTKPIGGAGLADFYFPNAKVKILGPNQIRLEALKKWWIAEIRRLGLVGFLNFLEELDDVFEFLCSHEIPNLCEQLLSSSDADLEQLYLPDNSVTNGSSISLIVAAEGRQLLFLGDSWAEDIVTALTPGEPTIFDAVKISHHGSIHNTSPDLLSLVDSPHFFISTNGDAHNHPDFAVLKAIVDRPANFRRTLHFNYSTSVSRKLSSYQSKAGADFVVVDDQNEWIAINS